MSYIWTKKITDEKHHVTLVHNKPEMLSTTQKESGIDVGVIPQPENNGKASSLFYNPITLQLFYEYSDIPLTQEEIAEKFRNSFKTANQKYVEVDLTTSTIEEVKDAKLSQLNELCNQSIVEGFTKEINGVVYHFSCSLSAQSNFAGTDALFKDGLIADVEWTVVNTSTGKVERLTLDKPTFNSVKLGVFQHINSNVSKFRDTLQPQVESATTNTEVDAVTW